MHHASSVPGSHSGKSMVYIALTQYCHFVLAIPYECALHMSLSIVGPRDAKEWQNGQGGTIKWPWREYWLLFAPLRSMSQVQYIDTIIWPIITYLITQEVITVQS